MAGASAGVAIQFFPSGEMVMSLAGERAVEYSLSDSIWDLIVWRRVSEAHEHSKRERKDLPTAGRRRAWSKRAHQHVSSGRHASERFDIQVLALFKLHSIF